MHWLAALDAHRCFVVAGCGCALQQWLLPTFVWRAGYTIVESLHRCMQRDLLQSGDPATTWLLMQSQMAVVQLLIHL